MPGALHGVRVIDFGQYVAGPLAAQMLGDEGADVIHVDPPGGPRWDRAGDAFLNRGKRRIVLDLKHLPDLELAHGLIGTADVVIENFRPGVMERLGIGPSAMTERDRRLIYCSLPGFGSEDPRAGVPAWEGTIKAATDDARVRAGEEPPGWDSDRPYYSALPIASNFAAILGATGIVMALIARHRSGKGQRVEVPLFDAMFEAIGGEAVAPRPLNWNGTGTYECKDGRWIQFNASNSSNARFLMWLVNAAGVNHWYKEGVLDYERVRREPALLEKLREMLTALFLTRTSWEWEELANRAGSCLCVARSSSEWMATEQARVTEAIVELDDPVLGPTSMAGFPVRLTRTPGFLRPRRVPDADRTEIISELEGFPKKTGPEAKEPNISRPLEGLKVIDLCLFLAGPTAGRILGEYGAEVVKINPPQKTRGNLGLHNRGKQSFLLDIESSEGQKVFWRLVEQADVVHMNFPEGTAERYGIGYDQVAARNEAILYSSVTCYGNGGPIASWRGFETQGQAMCGIVERLGDGEFSRPGISGPYNILDYGTGAVAAFGVALGLYHRYTTGEGQSVQAALAWTGTLHQGTFMLDYEGHEWDEPRGYRVLGLNALQRFYAASDGWFFLGAKPSEVSKLTKIEELEGLKELGGKLLETELERRFSQAGCKDWVLRLQEQGLGAHTMVRLPELMQDALVIERRLFVTQSRKDGSELKMIGNPVKLWQTPVRIGDGTAAMGEHGLAVLQRLGLGDNAEDLEKSWSAQVLTLPSASRPPVA